MLAVKSVRINNLIVIIVFAVTLMVSGLAGAAPSSDGQEIKEQVIFHNTAVNSNNDAAARLNSLNEINLYLSQMDSADLAATVKIFKVIQLLKSVYPEDISTNTLLSGAVKGTVNALGDPHSLYMDAKTYKELIISTKGTYGGVGIVLGIKDNVLTVVAPIEGTPADSAGILSGDQILKIDARYTKDLALDEAVEMIRGPENSQVTLSISRAGQELKEYTLTRSNIQLKSVSGKMLENNMGYIRISLFNKSTGEDFANKLQELEAKDMKALILDLRNNPGGLVDECVKVAGHLVLQGPVVSVVSKDGTKQTYFSDLQKQKYPLVVLVNGGSASASEIIAGAVQDTNVGTLIGTKTFGKGSVQNIFTLGDGTAVKVTIAKYYTPKDRLIHGVGIEPDIKIEMPDYKDNGIDLQLEKAIEVLKAK